MCWRAAGRERWKPEPLFDHSSDVPGLRRGHCGQGPTHGILRLTVDWSHPQTGVALGTANALSSGRQPGVSICHGGLMPGTSTDFPSREGRSCYPRCPHRKTQGEAGNRHMAMGHSGKSGALVGTQFCQQAFGQALWVRRSVEKAEMNKTQFCPQEANWGQGELWNSPCVR